MPKDKHASFAELYASCHLPLLRYVMTMLPNRAIAEDIVQETAKNLWEKFDQYDPQQPLPPVGAQVRLLRNAQPTTQTRGAAEIFLQRPSRDIR